jgi:YesN/AraC family two-component response regulator
MVGIPDPNYFGRCFKKYAGVSYSEYCRQIHGKEEH